MFHHSFEHMPDPLSVLQKTASILAPDGYCLVRVPVVDSFAWEHYREAWYQIDAPRHFFLHSRKSMGILARSAGLYINAIQCDSTVDQFRRSEQLIADTVASQPPDIWRKRQWKHRTERLNREGRGDQAAFYLRKGSS
jgi:lambda repressor-like predicted transcriptional regulator